MKHQHDLADRIVAQIIHDYSGTRIDLLSDRTQELWKRLVRTIHAAINHDLDSEIEPTNQPTP